MINVNKSFKKIHVFNRVFRVSVNTVKYETYISSYNVLERVNPSLTRKQCLLYI